LCIEIGRWILLRQGAVGNVVPEATRRVHGPCRGTWKQSNSEATGGNDACMRIK
jgi:hypothetical protein